ncbi:DUF3253 domain-containing protein [Paraconexibacter antarcticus]|uniref:DUF3253 domain-containing protein n=1 Tax=Paraconexibacter antarcticus TaxID=2949664 RepID=A0ABY5DWU8_9ACTN|nr:DUF3253 domain-containing protein [Paraconexibacter antarcticus]UTI66485.1 DUF3253 domain-containing protein [Paraconexibacter antarcticus]
MATDADIRATIDRLLDARGEGKTICPSDAARAIAPDDEERWRGLMDDVRRVAFALADDGAIEVTQRGEVVDGRRARGPIRLRRPG